MRQGSSRGLTTKVLAGYPGVDAVDKPRITLFARADCGGGGYRHSRVGTHAAGVGEALRAGKLRARREAVSILRSRRRGHGPTRPKRTRTRTFMVDHTFIYSGPVRKIKEIVDSGDLGEIYYVDSVRINLGLFQHDVNVVWGSCLAYDLLNHGLLGRPSA